MPIAAKFSEAFYQKFGHQATGELVEYLNTIDSTYRAELERLNDLNWGRVESRIGQAEARFEQRWSQLEARFEQRCSQIEARVDQRVAELRVELASLKAELLKWMFLFWLGTIGTVIALQQLQ